MPKRALNKRYTLEFKKVVIKTMQAEHLSLNERYHNKYGAAKAEVGHRCDPLDLCSSDPLSDTTSDQGWPYQHKQDLLSTFK